MTSGKALPFLSNAQISPRNHINPIGPQDHPHIQNCPRPVVVLISHVTAGLLEMEEAVSEVTLHVLSGLRFEKELSARAMQLAI